MGQHCGGRYAGQADRESVRGLLDERCDGMPEEFREHSSRQRIRFEPDRFCRYHAVDWRPRSTRNGTFRMKLWAAASA